MKRRRCRGVNWFGRENGAGGGGIVWPGYGQNVRVVKWMLDRLDGTAGSGVEHVMGVSPRYEDMEWAGLAGLELGRDRTDAALATDDAAWRAEFRQHAQHLARLRPKLPAALEQIHGRYSA